MAGEVWRYPFSIEFLKWEYPFSIKSSEVIVALPYYILSESFDGRQCGSEIETDSL